MDRERKDQRTSEDYLREHTVGERMSRSIHLVNYDPEWPRMFEREAQRILAANGDRALRVEHVGFTSVPELRAKPTIDIVLLVAESGNEPQYAAALEKSGYRLHLREPAGIFWGCLAIPTCSGGDWAPQSELA